MLVFLHAEPEDQIMLAFSCKTLLGVAALCNLQVPDPGRHRAPWASNQDQDSAFSCWWCRCNILEGLLRRFHRRDAKGRVRRVANLCVDCLRYRPTRKRYWTAMLAETDIQDWDKTQEKRWQTSVAWFGAGVKAQCPDCRVREHMWIVKRSQRRGII